MSTRQQVQERGRLSESWCGQPFLSGEHAGRPRSRVNEVISLMLTVEFRVQVEHPSRCRPGPEKDWAEFTD